MNFRLLNILFNLITFFITCNFLNAQIQSSNWIFGNKAEIKFPFGNLPLDTSLNNTNLFAFEGSATYSDVNGNLKLYTNGEKNYNGNHQEIIPENFTILGSSNSTQSSLIVPIPGKNNQFYLFTIRVLDVYSPHIIIDDQINLGLNYYHIDLNANNGHGKITRPNNNTLLNRTSQKLTSTFHTNGKDIWVVTHFINKFYSYLITENGISEPVISTSEYESPFIGYQANAKGQMKISALGNKLAIAHQNRVIIPLVNPNLMDVPRDFMAATNENPVHYGKMLLYDFDASTGNVTNEFVVERRNIFVYYGVEFSPSGKYLYYQGANNMVNKIFQLNTENLTRFDLHTFPENHNKLTGAMQLGVNGKIYYVDKNSKFLSVINYPEKDSAAAEFIFRDITLNTIGQNTLGLPNTVSTYNKEEIKILNTFDGNNACTNEILKFWINNNQPILNIVWNFGDGNTSTEVNPTHSYSTPGTYLVSVLVNGISYQKEITIHEPIQIPYYEFIACDTNNDGEIGINLQDFIDFVGPQAISVSFHPTRNDAIQNTNPIENLIIRVSNSTPKIWARIIGKGGCISYTEINFIINSSQLINDTKNVCLDYFENQYFLTLDQIQELYNSQISVFQSHEDADLFLNEITESILINETENQIDLYIRQRNNLACDEIYKVTFNLKKPTPFRLEDATICPYNGSILYQIPNDLEATHIQWNGLKEEDLNQNLNAETVIITQEGNYSLSITNQNGCTFTEEFTITTSPYLTVRIFIDSASNLILDFGVNEANNFQFSIDGGLSWNEGNSYNQLALGSYEVWIRDKNSNGCIVYKETITNNLLTNFFSPNDDGINDSWKINGFEKYEWITVEIYNRYGKSLINKKIEYSNEIWDGKVNGTTQKPDSYWFKLSTSENHIFQGYVILNTRY